MNPSDRKITSLNGLSYSLLLRVDCAGMLQGQLAELLGMPYSSLSALVAKLGVERQILGRAEAKVLKDKGLIHLHSRGGNFLPMKALRQVLQAIQSESARYIEQELSDYP